MQLSVSLSIRLYIICIKIFYIILLTHLSIPDIILGPQLPNTLYTV